MALTTTAHGFSGFSLTAPFVAFGRAIVRLAEANPRMRQIEELNNTTDEQLAERGVSRDDVVRHIFRDRLYL
ncbi:DUF1127 domain-containing protein [Actibacterium lipolyticum]|uniref:DUF1127 domain-containing protein n=1 Tax=Actibacterium lipolyticum TaxID=1524263 RepID=A0A238JUD2_9RHOB|nr:DUF1127 domain-containing protein [Actibacterium lipolyticum]SMX34261.1 hypothetical protein COL8621_01232 [Actibacterium lipolyticum]